MIQKNKAVLTSKNSDHISSISVPPSTQASGSLKVKTTVIFRDCRHAYRRRKYVYCFRQPRIMHFHHKGYRFSKDSDIAGGSLGSWRCQRRHAGCTARIHFSKKDNEVVAEFGAHNHDAPVASGEEGISFLVSSRDGLTLGNGPSNRGTSRA